MNEIEGGLAEEEVDYKKLYYELYDNVAKMLIENRFYNWGAEVLLSKWDSFRK